MISAGQRNRPIVFERTATVRDASGDEVPGVTTTIAEAFAEVNLGTGQERRDAAQERTSMAATFKCLWTPTLDTVREADRIVGLGKTWDITSIAPYGLNRELHFTAVTTS